jgi:predicted phage-related endonuclease
MADNELKDMGMIERRPITSRDEWLEWRREDVTASRVGALFGVHPYETALRLYAEKRGVEFPNEDNKTMRRGRWLEPAVATAVEEERPQWQLKAPKVYLRDPDLRLGCTPDYFIDGDPRGLGVLQCKTVAPSVYQRDWLGGSEIPFWIVVQTLVECMLADAAFGVVAALLVDPHAMEVAILEVPRHPESEAKIRAAVAAFWICVATGQEPDPDFTRDAETIRLLMPKEQPGKTVDCSGMNELPVKLDERAQLIARIKGDEARCEEIENEIRFLMNDAEVLTGLNGWRITYKSTERAGYTVKPKTMRVLRINDKRPQSEAP